jgi:hypothetical protein
MVISQVVDVLRGQLVTWAMNHMAIILNIKEEEEEEEVKIILIK